MTTMHAHWIQREEKGKEGGTEISQIALQCNKGSAKVASNPKSKHQLHRSLRSGPASVFPPCWGWGRKRDFVSYGPYCGRIMKHILIAATGTEGTAGSKTKPSSFMF